jgi:hypothetical protein
MSDTMTPNSTTPQGTTMTPGSTTSPVPPTTSTPN